MKSAYADEMKSTNRRQGGFHPRRGFHRQRRFHPPDRVDFVEKKYPLSNGQGIFLFLWGGRWDSNPRSSVPQTDALGQLRYTHHIGAPEGTRTPGPLLRRQVLYPAELQAPVCPIRTVFGAGDGNRTHTTSLEGWGSTTELHPQMCCLTAWFIIPHPSANVKYNFSVFSFSFPLTLLSKIGCFLYFPML